MSSDFDFTPLPNLKTLGVRLQSDAHPTLPPHLEEHSILQGMLGDIDCMHFGLAPFFFSRHLAPVCKMGDWFHGEVMPLIHRLGLSTFEELLENNFVIGFARSPSANELDVLSNVPELPPHTRSGRRRERAMSASVARLTRPARCCRLCALDN